MTPEEQDKYHDEHCWACGQRVPTHFRAWCAECGHTWRWKWQLSVADARSRWSVSGCAGPWDICPPWWLRVLSIRLQRPLKVWVCPCCSHDL